MANQVEKVNGIEIGKIEKINGLTDAEIEKINGLEFTGSTDPQYVTFATQDTGGTAIDGGTGFNTDRSEGTSLAFDPDTSQVIVAFSDKANSTVPTIRIGTVSGTTITFGDKIVVSSNTNGTTSTGCHYDTLTDRLIVVYRSNYSPYWTDAGIFAKAFELNSSRGVDTAGSVATVFNSSSGNEVSRGNLSEIQDHDGVVDVLYEDKSDGDDNYIKTVRVTNASTCALTVGSAAEFDTDASNYYGIAYSPDVDRNVVIYNSGNDIKAKAIEHLSGNAAPGSASTYNLSNSYLDASNPHGGSTMIYDTEHNKFHFLFRYNGSSGNNAVNDNLYIGNLTCGGAGNNVITFGNTGNPSTTMNNTEEIDDLKYGYHQGSNYAGGGLIYSHQRQRIIMHGNSSNAEANGTKKFHVIDYNGSAYTKSSSPIDINTQNGAPWDTGSIRTDNTSGTLGNVNLISFFLYGGSNDGKTFIAGIDAGDSAIS
tara:strand:+ start:58 stop:1497 length:1440 start_codon:yes stop_codon:yes gene_type:complete